jgi:hypothetical protein
MYRCTLLALLAAAAIGNACLPAAAAEPPAMVQLPAGARVGVVSLLDGEVTHFHAAPHLENSYLKTYPVGWAVGTMLLTTVRAPLTQRGLSAVPLAAGDALARARERCFLNAALQKGLPKECAPLYAQLAAAAHVDALIVLGPGRNDAAHSGGARRRELPDYLRGWCLVTGEGDATAAPQLLDLSELLLVAIDSGRARLADREWDASAARWSGYRAPADLKAIPAAQLDELQPLYAAMLQHQADGLLQHLQVSR